MGPKWFESTVLGILQAEEDALSFYSGQILLDARKEAKVTSHHQCPWNKGGGGEADILIGDGKMNLLQAFDLRVYNSRCKR